MDIAKYVIIYLIAIYNIFTLLKLIAIDNGYCLVCYYILILLYWS